MATAAGLRLGAASRTLTDAIGLLNERWPGAHGQAARLRHRVNRVEGLPRGSVTVELLGGYVMLKGEVPSAALRAEVERSVAAIHHQRRINNLITVAERSGASTER